MFLGLPQEDLPIAYRKKIFQLPNGCLMTSGKEETLAITTKSVKIGPKVIGKENGLLLLVQLDVAMNWEL